MVGVEYGAEEIREALKSAAADRARHCTRRDNPPAPSWRKQPVRILFSLHRNIGDSSLLVRILLSRVMVKLPPYPFVFSHRPRHTATALPHYGRRLATEILSVSVPSMGTAITAPELVQQVFPPEVSLPLWAWRVSLPVSRIR